MGTAQRSECSLTREVGRARLFQRSVDAPRGQAEERVHQSPCEAARYSPSVRTQGQQQRTVRRTDTEHGGWTSANSGQYAGGGDSRCKTAVQAVSALQNHTHIYTRRKTLRICTTSLLATSGWCKCEGLQVFVPSFVFTCRECVLFLTSGGKKSQSLVLGGVGLGLAVSGPAGHPP